jgi:RNA polymerase sigma-70 factor (ECF subfamily)
MFVGAGGCPRPWVREGALITFRAIVSGVQRERGDYDFAESVWDAGGMRCRSSGDGGDVINVSESSRTDQEAPDLLALYDAALPDVYGYLLSRCGDATLAEDLTAETFLAAVTTVRSGKRAVLTTGWLIGIARHKLIDHWRARSREQNRLRAVHQAVRADDDPWDERLDALRAQQTLERLAPHHRVVLVLRYLDDLSVPQVAAELGRTRHATEALIVRARAAFRRVYEGGSGGDD